MSYNEEDNIDLGDGFSYRFFQWGPDRDLNPKYAGLPDIEKAGIIIWKNEEAVASCWFDTPENHRVLDMAFNGEKKTPVWQLHSLDPLHIEPSIQMYDTNLQPSYHGFIRNGRWVQA